MLPINLLPSINIVRGNSLKQGGPTRIHLERFEEPLHHPTSGLTYPALFCICKQSVEDIEHLLGQPLIDWMVGKWYSNEAEYLQRIRNWTHACDERGLTDEERSKFNTELLNYIPDKLMQFTKR